MASNLRSGRESGVNRPAAFVNLGPKQIAGSWDPGAGDLVPPVGYLYRGAILSSSSSTESSTALASFSEAGRTLAFCSGVNSLWARSLELSIVSSERLSSWVRGATNWGQSQPVP